MLANLLPGFRHTRTPLAAGVLWLLIAWLAIGPGLLPQPDGGVIEGRLHDLATLVGRNVIVGTLALVVILFGGLFPSLPVGSVARRLPINKGDWKRLTVCRLFGVEGELSTLQGDFRHWLHRRASLVPLDLDWAAFQGRLCPPNLQVSARDLQEFGATSIGRETLRNADFGDADKQAGPRDWLMWGLAEASLQEELLSELPLRLQVQREQLFVTFDRIRAESELRAAVVLPLTVLLCILASDSAFWLLALAAPLWLLRQAVQSHVEAEQRLLSAVRYDVIQSSTVQFMDSVTDDPEPLGL